jgi:uncharacterized protein
MVVGVLTLELFFPHAGSLKDKRRILHGFKERIRSRYHVAVAEIGHQEKWQRALIGIATLNSRPKVVEDLLGRILSDARNLQEAEVSGQEIRFY